jgi:hypothetical protein
METAEPLLTGSEPEGLLHYEERLDRDPRWSLSEGSRHFEGRSAVFAALHKIAARLDALGIAWVVVGGMALFRHGLRRFTEDVDLLVTKEDLRRIHHELGGLGYLPAHRHSKHLRDTELGVRIEFLIAGDYPGDGREKPVSFPEPSQVAWEAEGIHYIHLPRLVELKLASGMTSPGRLRDLSDVLELIRILHLPREFTAELNPYVHAKFLELWREARKRYVLPYASEAIAPERLEEMTRDGILMEPREGGESLLVTHDPELARKYDMVEESELWSESEGE